MNGSIEFNTEEIEKFFDFSAEHLIRRLIDVYRKEVEYRGLQQVIDSLLVLLHSGQIELKMFLQLHYLIENPEVEYVFK